MQHTEDKLTRYDSDNEEPGQHDDMVVRLEHNGESPTNNMGEIVEPCGTISLPTDGCKTIYNQIKVAPREARMKKSLYVTPVLMAYSVIKN